MVQTERLLVRLLIGAYVGWRIHKKKVRRRQHQQEAHAVCGFEGQRDKRVLLGDRGSWDGESEVAQRSHHHLRQEAAARGSGTDLGRKDQGRITPAFLTFCPPAGSQPIGEFPRQHSDTMQGRKGGEYMWGWGGWMENGDLPVLHQTVKEDNRQKSNLLLIIQKNIISCFTTLRDADAVGF